MPARILLGLNRSSHPCFRAAHCRKARVLATSLSGAGYEGQPQAAASAAAETQTSRASATPYIYNDSDGKGRKATIEHIFPALEGRKAADPERPLSPWMMGWQMNERNLVWNDQLKIRLIKRIASDELGISDEEMDWRLQQLSNLLPGLESRLIKAPPKLVARLAAHTSDVAERLLQLKRAFPQANAAAMVNNRLTLLLPEDVPDLAKASQTLRTMLPGMNVDKFVELYPLVLDLQNFEMAIEDAKRIMPGCDPVQLLRSNPDLILSLVKGKNLLPYDAFDNPWA